MSTINSITAKEVFHHHLDLVESRINNKSTSGSSKSVEQKSSSCSVLSNLISKIKYTPSGFVFEHKGSSSQYQVPDDQLQRTHTLASQVLQQSIDFREKRPLQTELLSFSALMFDHRRSVFLSTLEAKAPKDLSSMELRQLENMLWSMYSDRLFIQIETILDVYNFAKSAFLSMFVDSGMRWKRTHDADVMEIDWETSKGLTPEATAICARLERRDSLSKKLCFEVRELEFELLETAPDKVDESIIEIIGLWKIVSVGIALGALQEKLTKYIEKSLKLALIDPNAVQMKEFMQQPELAKVGRAFREFLSEGENSEKKQYVLSFLQELIADKQRLTIAYCKAEENSPMLYERATCIYRNGIAVQVGFNADFPVDPKQYSRLSLPPLKDISVLPSLVFPRLFTALCERGEAGLSTELLSQVFSDDKGLKECVEEFLGYRPVTHYANPTIAAVVSKPIVVEEPARTMSPKKRPTSPKKTARPHSPRTKTQHQGTPKTEKISEEQLSEAIKSLSLEEAPSQSVKEQPVATSLPAIEPHLPSASSSTTTEPPEAFIRFAPTPRLHGRVSQWIAARGSFVSTTKEEQDSLDFHTYPMKVTRLMLSYVPPGKWYSEVTGKNNFHYSCLGSITRYGQNLPTAIGYFADCVDATTGELYHHFFHKTSNARLIASFKKEGSFVTEKDVQDDTVVSPKIVAKETVLSEDVSPQRFLVFRQNAITFVVNDLRDKTEYRLFLSI